MEDSTTTIKAVCNSEGISVGSVSGEAEGSQSDVPSDMEQCITDVEH
jgi:hypothetical protein